MCLASHSAGMSPTHPRIALITDAPSRSRCAWAGLGTRCHVIAIDVVIPFIVLVVLPFLAVQFFLFVIFFVPAVLLVLLVQVGIGFWFAFWQSRKTSLSPRVSIDSSSVKTTMGIRRRPKNRDLVQLVSGRLTAL